MTNDTECYLCGYSEGYHDLSDDLKEKYDMKPGYSYYLVDCEEYTIE